MKNTMQNTMQVAALLCTLALAGCATPPAPAPDPTDTAAVERLGTQAEQAMAAGQLVEAGRLYTELVKVAPTNVPGWYRLGVVYLRTGNPAYAQQAFETALSLDPKLTKAHANLALAHLGQFRQSARQALSSKDISDDNRRALQALLADVNQVLPPEGQALAR
jgi:Flp pilus assembly protein TadD